MTTATTDTSLRKAIDAAWEQRPPVGPSAADQLADAFSAAACLLDRTYGSEDLEVALGEATFAELEEIRDRARADITNVLVKAGLAYGSTSRPDFRRPPNVVVMTDWIARSTT